MLGNTYAMPDIYNKSWGMTEQGFQSLMAEIEKLDKNALMTKSGEQPANTSNTVMRGSTAVIKVIGPIFQYRNIITRILGFPAAEALAQDIQSAVDNYQVDSILLQVDSPGGQIGGINELAGIIQGAKKEKPVYAYVGGMGASAAYWIASAAKRIYVDATAQLGSIGVVFGLRRKPDDSLEIVNSESPQKRPDLDTEEGVELVRQRANDLAEVFIQAVANNRNMSRDQVVALKGGIKVGKSAIDAGFADEINSLEGILSKLKPGESRNSDYGFVKENHAELFEQIKQEGRDEAAKESQDNVSTREQARRETLMHAKAVLGQSKANLIEQCILSSMDPEEFRQLYKNALVNNARQRAGKQ